MLPLIQRWMQSVITHPEGVRAGVESAEARGHLEVSPDAIERVVTRSKALDSVGRLEIYATAYYARLLECLRDEFPALTAAVGEEAFDDLAFGYLQQCPSTSYTLNRLADRFPAYLAETRPPRDDEAAGPDWADMIVDLATLEWHFGQVFDGPGIEKEQLLSADDLQAIAPDRWPEARLVTAPCLRVLELRFPLSDYYAALRREEEPASPDAQPSWMAITRRDFVVRRHVLSRPQFVLLEALIGGATIGGAIARAAEAATDVDQLARDLRQWFHDWSRDQFFLRVELAQPRSIV